MKTNWSFYMPDTPPNRQIMKRVDLLKKSYKASYSEIIVAALEEFVKVKKAGRKSPDFRTPSILNIR